MRYVMSDVHGEYELFIKLMKKIGFSADDELYICGDVIEKGRGSVRLARLLFSMPNVHVIMGNHEHAFIGYYNFMMQEHDGDYDTVLQKLKDYINLSGDGDLLDWDVVDRIESLPYYIEADDFICVHAGLTLTDSGEIPPLDKVSHDELVSNRRFKNPDVVPVNSKCVFFGHTATSAVCGENKFIAYNKPGIKPDGIRGFAKIHLDTCTMISGVLGCFCVDTCRAFYVARS